MIGTTEEIIRYLFAQEDREKIFEIKEYKKKRSLNANAYCWTLIGKIAREMKITKEEVYKQCIKEMGVYRILTISSDAVPTFKKLWNEKGLGYLSEESKSKFENMTDIIAYYGSSSYNTKQMSVFIDYIVQEAKELGIETLTPSQLEDLKRMWENENSNKKEKEK